MTIAVIAVQASLVAGPFIVVAACTFCGIIVYLGVGWLSGFALFRASASFLTDNLFALGQAKGR
jgi:hypothetical protein